MTFRVGLVIALVVTGILAGAGPIGTAQSAQPEPVSVAGAPEEIDADETRLDISLRADGTAEWTVEFWMRLDDNESIDAFESLRTDIEEDPDAYTQEFGDRIDATVTTASDATNREMSADEFAVATSRQTLGPEYGVVTYTFRWNGFAAVDGEELHAGDAIEGIYLDDDTRLSIDWPAEYELVSVSPEPDDRRDRVVIWHGTDTEFVSDEPRVVVSTGNAGFGSAAFGVALFALAAIGVGGAWWYRSRSTTSTSDPSDGGSSTSASADSGATDPQSETDADPDSDRDPRNELLSNEEQVLRLLEEYDGRLKQQTIVEELEWTDAKTSKVVSKLREAGRLESFRLGRENVLRLPDTNTDDTDSDGERDSIRTE